MTKAHMTTSGTTNLDPSGTRNHPSRSGGGWAALFLAAAALLAIVTFTAMRDVRISQAAPAETPAAPLFAETVPARNPSVLHLLADEQMVLGWISGTKDFVGRNVTVDCAGIKQVVLVQEGNFFTWSGKVEKPTDATFSVEGLKQTIRLVPAAALEPSVFFVVDRTAYRPEQTLQFAGFLRKLDDTGRFVPIANQAVKVQIKSEQKKQTAAELALTSDEHGRIVGNYTFTDADVLDGYQLTVPGFRGGARVVLAEYRKSKIRLKISGKVEDQSLRLAFDALDFLDKPVGGSKVHFVAQVVGKPLADKTRTLKGEDFVYNQPWPWALPDVESMSPQERLLYEADPALAPLIGAIGMGGQVEAQIEGDLDLADGQAEHVMKLNNEWIDGRHCVNVQGVLVDVNGREQRASEQVALRAGGGSFDLHVEKMHVDPGELIRVTAGGKGDNPATPSTLVAMRLSPAVQTSAAGPYYGNDTYFYAGNSYPYASSIHNRADSIRWRPHRLPMTIARTLAAAAPFKDGKAEIRLAQSGAYVLVGMAQLPDGSAVQSEVSCVVREADDRQPLILNLDKDEYASGETMQAEIHSRFANARVLLTIRDGNGLRFRRSVQLAGGVARVSHFLSEDLRYGCSVQVQYADSPGRTFVAEKFIRVTPEGRMLKIHTTMKDVVDAGSDVKIGIRVNRQEEVDLVVSVYDQSLLGIAPDKFTDIRSFYLADERVRTARHRQLLAARLGGVTVGGAIEQAQKLLNDKAAGPTTSERAPLQAMIGAYNGGRLFANDIATLLNVVGVKAHWQPSYGSGRYWYVPVDKAKAGLTMLFDLIDGAAMDLWRLEYCFCGPTLILTETHPNYRTNAYGYYGLNQLYFDQRGFGRFAARGDAHLSISGNASFSEGQAFISHLGGPGQAPPALIDVDPSESGIAVRRDFSDAAYWNASIRTDPSGNASVEFKLPDSLTNWQVVVTAVSKDMHVGSAKSRFTSTKPVMVWPMLPRVFTEGDEVEIYGSIHNRTDKDQTIKVSCKVENGLLLSEPRKSVTVKAGRNAPVYWTFQAGNAGYTQILMTAECDAGSDASLKRLPVVEASAEQVLTASGFCRGSVSLTMPKGDYKNSKLEVCLVPSLAADINDTLDYLVDYPHGCVEQTMSRFLPAIKVAQVLNKFRIEQPSLQQKLPGCVDAGIKRLLQLQRPDGGWGWNGSGQTHEMMTPYALYGLLEAERAGYKLPAEDAVNRGLDRLKGFIDNMGEKQAADRIYCMYVYALRRDISPAWWTFIEDQLGRKALSDYATALALEMAVQKEKKTLAADLARSLRASAQKSGEAVMWKTAGFSRWGDDVNEVTAAAMKALVACDADDPLIPGVLTFFAEGKRGNRWNSTKDTAMIVYALCDYLNRQDADLRGPRRVTLAANDGQPSAVTLDDGLMKKIVVDGDRLKTGENVIRFDKATAGMMYRLVLRYRASGADVAPFESGVRVSRAFYLLDGKGGRVRQIQPGQTVPRGSYIESEVTASNAAGQAMRYVLVSDGKPSCCEVLPADDIRYRRDPTGYVLREEKTAKVLYHHEQTGTRLVDRCVMHAEFAGRYVVAPASVELMYQSETRGHSGAFQFKVADADKVAAASLK